MDVKVTGQHLQGRSGDDYFLEDVINYEPLETQYPDPSSRGKPRIGFVGAHVKDHFVRDNSIPFDESFRSIFLGRYGRCN